MRHLTKFLIAKGLEGAPVSFFFNCHPGVLGCMSVLVEVIIIGEVVACVEVIPDLSPRRQVVVLDHI